MNAPHSFDLEYRPESYWTVPDAIFAGIKGTRRRQMLREAITTGNVDALPAVLLRDKLPAPLLALLRKRYPSFMGGETLHDCEPGEVEIARVTYVDTVLGDVVSFRAHPAARRIRYRAVSDNADDVPCERKMSSEPLTMLQVIRLINRAGHGTVYWSRQVRCGVDRSDLPSFNVESFFYPQLRDCYAERAEAWMQRSRGSGIDPRQIAAVRRSLLDNLRWEERAIGIRRDNAEREAAVRSFLSLRVVV